MGWLAQAVRDGQTNFFNHLVTGLVVDGLSLMILVGGALRYAGKAAKFIKIGKATKAGASFKSFSSFKRAMGSAGSGKAWHHIVEQNPSNLAKFGSEAIHNTNNLMKLPHGAGSIHAKISGFYSSKQAFTGGSTVRQWLGGKSFQKQYDFGIKVLKQYGSL